MQIIKLNPQGYCGGVKRALKLINDALNDPSVKKPIWMLGNIIHNKNVINELIGKGVKCVDSKEKSRYEMLDEINEGTVVFSAHGISPRVVEKAKAKGLNIIDATCPNVYIVHKNIISHLNDGYTILYIGTPSHPEAEAVLDLDNRIIFISSIDQIDSLTVSGKIYVTNQTTLSSYDIKDYFQKIIKKYPNAIIDDKICQATTLRQKAVIEQKADLCIVVGDKSSSNSQKLKTVCEKNANIKSYIIEDVSELKTEWFNNVNIVSITSGASTPDEITDKVIKKIELLNL